MAVGIIREAGVRPWRSMGWALQKWASCLGSYFFVLFLDYSLLRVQAFKHIFTSPSSVEKENKATRSGNARIHGMTRVTMASLAYVATQVSPSLTGLVPSITEHPRSFVSPCHPHPPSAGLTLQPTRKDSTRAYGTFWTIQMRGMRLLICWAGGIGRFFVGTSSAGLLSHPFVARYSPAT